MSDRLNTSYRPDIDGLRALAVLSVIAFHVGLPGVTGGFVGVDVFFVISGFLITGLLLHEAQRHGSVALAAFFARRVRRLMPALVTVLLATLLLSLWLMFPQELPRLGKSAMSVALISSNVHFLKYSGGYFDPSTDLRPLLHTWSLAVEEQYYLVWPLLFLAICSWSKRRGGSPARGIQWMLWAVLAVSFPLNAAFVAHSKSSVFYLMPFRAWEFALGGLLNFYRPQLMRSRRAVGEGLFFGGLAAVLGTVFLLTDRQPFPGAIAAIPTLGAAAIVAGGTVAAARWPQRILGSRPMVSLGLVSYSWYLWHWPLISLHRSYNLGARSMIGDGLIALLALFLSWATYRTIEVPIRFRKPWLFSSTRGTLWLGAAMSFLLLAAAGAVIEYGKREAARYDRLTGVVVAQEDSFRLDKCRPDETRRTLDPAEDCTLGAASSPAAIVAWGDSHIEHWKPLLAEAAGKLDMRIVMRVLNTCPPLLGAVPYKRNEGMYGCGYDNDNVMDELRRLARRKQVQGVILGARWNEYLAMQETDPAAMLAWALADDWKALEKKGGGEQWVGTPPYDHEGSAATEARALRRTLVALAEANLRVLVVAPVPELYFNGPQCLYLRSAAACVVARSKVDERRRATLAAIETATAGMNNVRVWDPIGEFCDDRACYAQRNGIVMYSDHNHVSPGKARALLPKLAPYLAWLRG